MRCADGGYLSWCYGTSFERQNEAWNAELYSNYLFVVDGNKIDRNEIYADYKGKRVQRREEDPKKMAMYQQVREFQRTHILGSEKLVLLGWPTLEADDLLALTAWLFPGQVDLLAIDKDLLQLIPYLKSFKRLDTSDVTLAHYIGKLPVAVKDLVKKPEHIPLVLALLGDKSDSIPRLVPPRDFNPLRLILQDSRPWRAARLEYGVDVLRNVLITLLPYPRLFGLSDDEIFDRLDLGGWRPNEGLLQLADPEILLLIHRKVEQINGRTSTSSHRSKTEEGQQEIRLPGGDVSGREAEAASDSPESGEEASNGSWLDDW